MIFSELYSAYYNAVARILRVAVSHPVTTEEMRKIIADNAFDESALAILPALTDGRWPLLRKDGTTPLQSAPTMPLTKLQKSWLNAISQDPRCFLRKKIIMYSTVMRMAIHMRMTHTGRILRRC